MSQAKPGRKHRRAMRASGYGQEIPWTVSVSLQSFPSLVSRSWGLRAASQPSPAAEHSEGSNGKGPEGSRAVVRREQVPNSPSIANCSQVLPGESAYQPIGPPWSLPKELFLSFCTVSGIHLTTHNGLSGLGSCQDTPGIGHPHGLVHSALWVSAAGPPKERDSQSK